MFEGHTFDVLARHLASIQVLQISQLSIIGYRLRGKDIPGIPVSPNSPIKNVRFDSVLDFTMVTHELSFRNQTNHSTSWLYPNRHLLPLS